MPYRFSASLEIQTRVLRLNGSQGMLLMKVFENFSFPEESEALVWNLLKLSSSPLYSSRYSVKLFCNQSSL